MVRGEFKELRQVGPIRADRVVAETAFIAEVLNEVLYSLLEFHRFIVARSGSLCAFPRRTSHRTASPETLGREFLRRPPELLAGDEGQSRHHHGAHQEGIEQHTDADNDPDLRQSDER